MARDQEFSNFPGFRSRLQQFPNFGGTAPTNILNHQRHTIASRRRRCSFIKALSELESTEQSPPRPRSFFKFGSMRSSNTRSNNNSSSGSSTEKTAISTFHSRFSRKPHVADVLYKLPHLYRDEERNVSSSSSGTVKHNPQSQNRPFLQHTSLFTPTQQVTPRPTFISQRAFASSTSQSPIPQRDDIKYHVSTYKSTHKFAPLSSSPPEFRPCFMRDITPDKAECSRSRCPVCLEGFTKKVAVQPCNHALCAECFAHWQLHCYRLGKYASCPDCSTEVNNIKWLS